MALKNLNGLNKPASFLIILFCFLVSGLAHAQKPGAYYWGDADGNGIIEIPDLIALNTVLGNFGSDDTVNYNGYPQSRYRQDLDGNGIMEIPDLIVLNGWIPGNFSSRPGNPDQLLLDGDTHLTLNMGDSITLSAYAISPVTAGSQVRTGFGVIFKIDASSTCTTAQIYGYDVAGGLTVNAWRSNSAYRYTLKPGAPDNGRARVRVNTNGCSGGQSVVIQVYIPDDSEAGVVLGRFPVKLSALQKIYLNVAALHDYWVANTVLRYSTPAGRANHVAVSTGTEMITWGGFDGLSHLYTGGRYNPATDAWIPTSTTDAPSGRELAAAVWTGTMMIVGGGFDGAAFLNNGSRYNPATDSWDETTTTNAPAGRYYHTAVWSGTEMIVWGGWDINTPYSHIGGKYNPTTDSWTATTTTNAPSAREYHTAVWTGTYMVVWGGNTGLGVRLNTGGKYNPSTSSWTATSTTGVPSPRDQHTAVWTGTLMIVSGGYPWTNTGGRYNPSADSWTATTTINALAGGRQNQTAVWTGTEMIIWGGSGSEGEYLNTGGRYVP